MDISRLTIDEWADDQGRNHGQEEPFHRPAVLRVVDRHADGDLQLYGGYKGDQLVAMAPVVVSDRTVGRTITSPPPAMGIPHMGPVLLPRSPKRRSQEKLNQRFATGLLDALDVDDTRTLFRMVTSPAVRDSRPYAWRDLRTKPLYTYVVDLADRTPEDLESQFSRSLRRDIRNARESEELTVSIEGIDAARTVFEDVASRYAEQDESLGVTWPYVSDLAAALDERFQTYVARDADGSYLSGLILLYGDDRAFFWQGGTRTDHDAGSVNSLLHWHAMVDIIEDPPVDSVAAYDLMGANTERLCTYKGKFGAELVPYFVVESTGLPMRLAKKAFDLVSK